MLLPTKSFGLFLGFKEAVLIDGNRIQLTWDTHLAEAPDFLGYRIYNKAGTEILVDEKILGKDAVTWTSGPLEGGRRHAFKIKALTQFGLETPLSRAKGEYVP